MHEMSIAESILELALEEAEKNNCKRIVAIEIKYGALSGIMADALTFCFEALIKNTAHENTVLKLEKLPLLLRCPFCQTRFVGKDEESIWQPCPQCGEQFGHIVEQGKELIFSRLEAEKD